MGSVKASSSNSGFFQALPVVPAQYTASPTQSSSPSHHDHSDDPVLSRILSLYLPCPTLADVSNQLHDFSRLVLQPSTLQHTIDCDTDLPTLHPLTTFGEENKTSPLRTSEGWRALKQIQTRAGVVGYGYPQYTLHQTFNRRIHQFAILHLWHGTAAVATCPMAMTDGAAVLLRRHLDDADGDQPGRGAVFLESHRRLVSLDPNYAWTSGQWMTERSGGSDVRGTETVARRLTEDELQSDSARGRNRDAHGLPLGPWVVDGFKWFSSATDANMAVLLAQTSRGLSAFYAPLRRQTGHSTSTTPPALTTETSSAHSSSAPTEMNGVRIQRLKSKLGTKGVPTAELELKGMRAFLIGQEGQGVKEISSILNITRLHTASSGAGYLARGLAVSRAYTQVRQIRGSLLSNNAQHLAWMASESVKYRAHTHLVFLGIALLGASEQGYAGAVTGTQAPLLIPEDPASMATLLRILTPVMKAQVTLNSVSGLHACMESLGGVGYCENNDDGGVLNLARLLRDSVVGSIWEGTTSVMAEDVLRVLKNPRSGSRSSSTNADDDVLDRVLGTWMRRVLGRQTVRDMFPAERRIVANRYDALKLMVARLSVPQLLRSGRVVLQHIEAVACACLLMYDASIDADEVAVAVAKRWVAMTALPADADLVSDQNINWEKEVDLDRKIFLGAQAVGSSTPLARL